MFGGTHFIADFENCACSSSLLTKHLIAEALLREIISKNGLTILSSNFNSVGDGLGFTGVITLLESHLSIHTWPERNFINLDLFTCNYTVNNYIKTHNIYNDICKLFLPANQNLKIISRKNILFDNTIDYSTWGYHLTLNLYKCNNNIKDATKIREYVTQLCELIEMKRFGDCQCVHFGEDERVAGYSMFQLIETSNVAGHFVNINNNAYLDIFSCKKYDIMKAIDYSVRFFDAQDYLFNYFER